MKAYTSRNMELYAVRVYGIIWIALAIFLLAVIVKDPKTSGMAIGFLGLSIGMSYMHLSGNFDPPLCEIECCCRWRR